MQAGVGIEARASDRKKPAGEGGLSGFAARFD
jgi:hypothetical protein